MQRTEVPLQAARPLQSERNLPFGPKSDLNAVLPALHCSADNFAGIIWWKACHVKLVLLTCLCTLTTTVAADLSEGSTMVQCVAW